MGMTPIEFFEGFVEGNLQDCLDDPGSVRRAFNAAISASHLADHFYTFNQRHNPQAVAGLKDSGQLVEHLTKETSGAFRDVMSVANAYKHLYTDSSSKYGARSTIDSAGSITSIETLSATDVVKVEERFGDSTLSVVFTRRDGSSLEFLPVLQCVVDYWLATIR